MALESDPIAIDSAGDSAKFESSEQPDRRKYC
jgi:hypothetical protein